MVRWAALSRVAWRGPRAVAPKSTTRSLVMTVRARNLRSKGRNLRARKVLLRELWARGNGNPATFATKMAVWRQTAS